MAATAIQAHLEKRRLPCFGLVNAMPEEGRLPRAPVYQALAFRASSIYPFGKFVSRPNQISILDLLREGGIGLSKQADIEIGNMGEMGRCVTYPTRFRAR